MGSRRRAPPPETLAGTSGPQSHVSAPLTCPRSFRRDPLHIESAAAPAATWTAPVKSVWRAYSPRAAALLLAAAPPPADDRPRGGGRGIGRLAHTALHGFNAKEAMRPSIASQQPYPPHASSPTKQSNLAALPSAVTSPSPPGGIGAGLRSAVVVERSTSGGSMAAPAVPAPHRSSTPTGMPTLPQVSTGLDQGWGSALSVRVIASGRLIGEGGGSASSPRVGLCGHRW